MLSGYGLFHTEPFREQKGVTESMHGDFLGSYAYGLWAVVIYYTVFFLFFAVSFLRPKKRYEWRSMGALTGFFVALFTEMFGFPLTIFFLTAIFGDAYPAADPFSHANGHLILVITGLSGSHNALKTLHLISNTTILLGSLILFLGWLQIHRSDENTLVRRKLYSIVRHPQYVGLFLVTTGFLVQWPSLLVFLMWPVMTMAYIRLARKEDEHLAEKFGQLFTEYRQRVPAFFPRLVPSRALSAAVSRDMNRPR